MKNQKVLLMAIGVLIIAIAFSACQKSTAENKQEQPQSSPTVSPITDSSPISTPNAVSSVREVDFKNFTYTWTKGQEIDEKEFTLKDGEKEMTDKTNGASLYKVEYGDVTSDGVEEAMISLAPETGGNCSCEMVYIYTLENQRPKLLWSFDTEDRAQGGLKRVYANKSELIVETFGDNKFENDQWSFSLPKDKFGGLCCPTAYTKIRFKWNGEKFAVAGKPELFDYDWKKEMSKQ
jgi:hypothetical protein